jgi:4-hydroxybenzoate polyprenyltransferase
MRPKQWLKNVFVFTGIIFGGSFYNETLVMAVIQTTVAFCLTSSGVYIVNDIVDVENDRVHPVKKNRPLASGKVSLPSAIVLGVLCLFFGIYLASTISAKVLGIIVSYVILNIAYSFKLKHVVILDVFCIATGFMMRILAGTAGVGIPPSKWLLLCGLLMTLFLGFAKRRSELSHVKNSVEEHRYVLKNYDPGLLDTLSAICAAGVIMGYSLYTMSPDTVRMHGTENLMYSVPPVIYALFRYLYLMHKWGHGGDPTHDLFRDKHILAAVAIWAAVTIYVLR